MQVNVYVTGDARLPYQLLVLPFEPSTAIPCHLQHVSWRHLAQTDMKDRLLAAAKPVIEAEIVSDGFSLLDIAT